MIIKIIKKYLFKRTLKKQFYQGLINELSEGEKITIPNELNLGIESLQIFQSSNIKATSRITPEQALTVLYELSSYLADNSKDLQDYTINQELDRLKVKEIITTCQEQNLNNQ